MSYHVHPNDTRIQVQNVRLNTVIEATPSLPLPERRWVLHTVGHGHGKDFWHDLVSALRAVGYDVRLSIEGEDEFVDATEGLEKALAFLTPIVLEKPASTPRWEYESGWRPVAR